MAAIKRTSPRRRLGFRSDVMMEWDDGVGKKTEEVAHPSTHC